MATKSRSNRPRPLTLFFSAFVLAMLLAQPVFAAKENFDRSKPHVNIGTIGHVDHGKTTLTAALADGYKSPLKNRVIRYVDIDGSGWIEMNALAAKIRSERNQYRIHDFNHEDTVKNMIVGGVELDGALLVVSAANGVMPQTREHILLARQTGVPTMVVFINGSHLVSQRRLAATLAQIGRELKVNGYGKSPIVFDAEASPSGKKRRGKGANESSAIATLRAVVAAMDGAISRPAKAADRSFLMPIEDVFSITGRGTVATGRIETGRVDAGDRVEVVGENVAPAAVLEVWHSDGSSGGGESGDSLGLLLRGIEKADIRRGMVIAKPGSITPHARFIAQIYVLKKEEGGRHTPFHNKYRPQFSIRTTDVTGEILLSDGRDLVYPGEHLEMGVFFDQRTPLNVGLRFAIREGGRTVGAGQVTEIIQ